MSDYAIEIEKLRKTYKGVGSQPAKEALKGVDLKIPAGSIFGLLGPNGAGKSTLINIMAGLVVKTSGRVRIWGFDQDVNPRQSRAPLRSAYRPQRHSQQRQQLRRLVRLALQSSRDLLHRQRLQPATAMHVQQHRCPQES